LPDPVENFPSAGEGSLFSGNIMLALLKIIKALSVGLSDSDLLSSRGKPSISGRAPAIVGNTG
jgi:hypothetical protein